MHKGNERKMRNNAEGTQNNIMEEFQSFHGNEELLAKVIDCFPYPIEVYAPDGTAVLVNKAMLTEYHVSDPDMIIGKCNIFMDPAVIATGQFHLVKQAFQGETVFHPDIKVPLDKIAEQYGLSIEEFQLKCSVRATY